MGRMSNHRWLPDTYTPSIFQACFKSSWLTGYRSFESSHTVFCTHFVTKRLWFLSQLHFIYVTEESLYFHNDIFNFNSKLLSSFMQIKCWWSRIMAFLYVFLQSTGKTSIVEINLKNTQDHNLSSKIFV